jgi:hypothetical protein
VTDIYSKITKATRALRVLFWLRRALYRLLRPAELHCGPRSVHPRAASLRTGLLTVGMPGSTLGVQKEDPPIADLLKPLGYASA